ncbi:DUF4176 domain-containing protein [Enterococcus sp. LJL98]
MLPVGSLVAIEGSNQIVMILNRRPNVKKGGNLSAFDYTGAFYPQGLEKGEKVSFNQTEVTKIVSKGFRKPADRILVRTFYQKR